MTETRTIGELADTLGLDYVKLRTPFKRLQQTNLYLVIGSDGGATPKNKYLRQITNINKYFAKASLVDDEIFNFVKDQFEYYQNEITNVESVCKRSYLNEKDLSKFIKNFDRNEQNDFIARNMFSKNQSDALIRTRIDDLISLYLKKKISETKDTTAVVPSFDAKTKLTKDKIITVHLLEGIRTRTWKQGVVVGFYFSKKAGCELPIVALYNQNIELDDAVKLDPKSRGNFHFAKRKLGNKQPVVWTIPINDLIDYSVTDRRKKKEAEKKNVDSHYFYFLNMLLSTLSKYQIGCEFLTHGNYRHPFIQIITDPVIFHLNDFIVSKDDVKKVAEIKLKTFGKSNVEELEKTCRHFTQKLGTNFRVVKNKNELIIQSDLRKVLVGWFDKESEPVLKGLQEYSVKSGIPMDLLAGKILQDFYSIYIEPSLHEEATTVADQFKLYFKENGEK